MDSTVYCLSEFFFPPLPLLPGTHLAVHDGWWVKVSQQVVHQIVILLVSLNDAIITGHVGAENVLHQLLEALLLTLAVSLQQATVLSRLEVTLKRTQREDWRLKIPYFMCGDVVRSRYLVRSWLLCWSVLGQDMAPENIACILPSFVWRVLWRHLHFINKQQKAAFTKAFNWIFWGKNTKLY